MKKYKYTGVFISAEGHTFRLVVICNGVLQAFFLLTADAIRGANHYQLNSITDEKGNKTMVGDIMKCHVLFS